MDDCLRSAAAFVQAQLCHPLVHAITDLEADLADIACDVEKQIRIGDMDPFFRNYAYFCADHKHRLSLDVVLFFEIMLVAAVVAITWFALYTLYRLITDES